MLRNHKILNLFIGLLLASVSAHATLITMTNSDSTATTTYLQVSFTSKGFWNSSIAPSSANDYSTTATNSMRTPSDGTNYIFQGNSLTINGPGTTTAGGGRLITKNQPATALPITYTIANLVITNLGMIQNGANTSGSTAVIAGGITTSNGGWDLLPQNGSMVIAASVSGNGPLWLGSPSAASANSAIFMGAISNWTGSIFSVNNTTLLVLSNALTQTYSGNIMCTNNAVTVQGSGILTLSGTNTYAGKTTLSGGTLVLAGNEASVTNSTTVSSGATLQLQANSTNIVSGTSYSLGTAVTAANTFSVGSTIQFRSDSGVIFNGGANLGGLGNGINSWDVNQLTGAGANNTLTFAPAGFSVFNSTFNITGGNGYTLAVGPMNLIGTGGTLTLNASNANLTVNGITSVGASGVTTVLGSSNTTISAAITATTSLTKQGIGKLTLNGANTYVGSTLIQTGTVALASGATLASTNLNISVGATLDVGAFSGALAMNSGQYLIGKGAVNGSVDTASGGLIYPGGNLAAGTRVIAGGVACYSSTNLYDWKNEGLVLPSVAEDPDHDLACENVIERPKVIYNARTKKFVMWLHQDSPDYAAAHAGVAVSDSPTGTFKYLGSFRPNAGVWPMNVTAKDKQPSVTNFLARDFQSGQMARDMTLFVDDDGKAYQFYASEGNPTMQVSQLTDDYLKPAGKYARIFVGRSTEAPAVFKRNGKYYLIASGCSGWDPNTARSAVADNIFGPWTELGNPCRGANADKTFFLPK